jgi:SAM-dependent methyltransferase
METAKVLPVARMWARVSPHWRSYAEYADARAADVTAVLLDRTGIRAGERVLELACGAGGTGLAAAIRVGPGGHVLMSDLVPEMTAIAYDRAAELGLTNTSVAVLDLEQIDQPDGSFDVVLCREGLMFALDPRGALAEIRRVLRPGGRMALAVWGPRARNPWLGLVFDAVTAQTGQPVPPPGIPGPFALSDQQRLGNLIREAGFAEVAVTEQSCPVHDRSFEDWWTRTCALAGPLAARLAAMSETDRAGLTERARTAARAYQTPDGMRFPGVALVASGRLPTTSGHHMTAGEAPT